MKKVSILFVSALALGLTFTSCDKDDDNSTTGSVEGKWNFNKYSITSGGITTPEQDYDDNEAGCDKDFIELKAAGVYNEGDYITDCELDSYPGTWSKTGNTISVTMDGETETFEVASVSGSELRVKTTYTEGGTTYTYNVLFTKA